MAKIRQQEQETLGANRIPRLPQMASVAIAVVTFVVLVGALSILFQGVTSNGTNLRPSHPHVLQTIQEKEDWIPLQLALQEENRIDPSTTRFLGEHTAQYARHRYWAAYSRSDEICLISWAEGRESDWWAAATGCASLEQFSESGVYVGLDGAQYFSRAVFVADGYAQDARQKLPNAIVMDNLIGFDSVAEVEDAIATHGETVLLSAGVEGERQLTLNLKSFLP